MTRVLLRSCAAAQDLEWCQLVPVRSCVVAWC